MNVVDSSAWLEYFADGPNAKVFAPAIEGTADLVVPTISLLEVFKRVLQQRNEADALRVTAVMKQARVVELDSELALAAARLSFDLKLPLADSVIYATARKYDAVVWTQDKDFEGLANVRYVAKI
jgi:predicted nucleic acid-binding protein